MTTLTLCPAPIPGFSLAFPSVTPRLPFTAAMPAAERLDEKYRPATLAEVMGQGAVVFQLETFLDAPHSTAFLFEGESGVGKTSAARALANDLGVDPDWGFELIESARGDMEAVERALRMLRHVAPGSGWKMILVDEADLMTPRAAQLWLSALENLPPQSVVVFTTNRPGHFPDRFLDRCERLRFESNGQSLRQDAQAIIDRVWKEETGMNDAPSVDDIPNLIDGHGVISFRRAVLALAPMIRAKHRTTMPAGRPSVAFGVPEPIAPQSLVVALATPLTPPAAKPARKPRPHSPKPAPVSVSFAHGSLLATLAARLDAELTEHERIADLCFDAVQAVEAAQAELKAAPRGRKDDCRAQLERAEYQRQRCGAKVIAINARIARTRDEIKRAK